MVAAMVGYKSAVTAEKYRRYQPNIEGMGLYFHKRSILTNRRSKGWCIEMALVLLLASCFFFLPIKAGVTPALMG